MKANIANPCVTQVGLRLCIYKLDNWQKAKQKDKMYKFVTTI